MKFKTDKYITRDEAKQLFQVLCDELEKEDSLDSRSIMLVNNIVLLEQMKYNLYDDILTRGVVELFVNGSQELFRDNKSVDKIKAIVEQQRKLQAELKLTPASEKKIVEVIKEEHNPFKDF